MNVLPSITEKQAKRVEETLNAFIWNNKRSKMNIRKLQNSKDRGGIKLMDILKKDWDSTQLNILANQFLPIKGEIFWRCNIAPQDVNRVVSPSFWRDVAFAWSKINFKIPKNRTQIRSQILWYNSNIKINKRIVFYKRMFQAGIATIDDILLADKHGFMSHQELLARFGDCVNFLQYAGLC